MTIGSLLLVEPAHAGNLGSVMRIAANFGVRRLDLVRPRPSPDDPEVLAWACGADRHLEIRVWNRFADAAASYRTLVATASGRGRRGFPVVDPATGVDALVNRGLGDAALVFGNETSGLRRDHLDRSDLVIRIPTSAAFPVLNLAQAVAILVAGLAMSADPAEPPAAEPPARSGAVDGLMLHLAETLAEIGFTDPGNPDRVLRKLRRLFGRAGITENEVKIVRGICRQVLWAARNPPEVVADSAERRRRGARASSLDD